MRRLCAVTAALALLCLGGIAQANITIDTVAVGNAGNVADTASHSGNPAGPGSVSYNYNIGKYEVTTAQYTAFLNAVAKTDTYGLYNTYMVDLTNWYGCNIQRTGTSGNYSYTVASDWANRPVNYVSFWDSCRFANWLGNGQKAGAQDLTTTEDGAYYLNGYTGADGRTIQRRANWTWAVTSEDEWYKAACYKGGGINAGYWLYPTKSDTAPGNVGSDGYTDPGNHANYLKSGYTIGSPYYRTNVGEFENSASTYGTFDQGGNVWEWNETVPYDGPVRCLYGGSFTTGDISASSRGITYPDDEGFDLGFRVSQVPEPGSIIALLGGLASLLGVRRRRV